LTFRLGKHPLPTRLHNLLAYLIQHGVDPQLILEIENIEEGVYQLEGFVLDVFTGVANTEYLNTKKRGIEDFSYEPYVRLPPELLAEPVPGIQEAFAELPRFGGQ